MVNKYTFFLLTSFLVLFASCSKDKEEIEEETHYSDYFTAVITPYGNPEKTYIESGEGQDYSCWADGDAVNINGTVRVVDVTGSADNYTATIGADDIEAVNGGFLAAYPGDAVTVDNGSATFILPATTEYTTVSSGAGAGTQVVDAPMVAYTTARDLQFENVGLLTLFNLKIAGSGQVTLQRITVSSDQPLCGSYSMTRQGDGWQRNATGLDGNNRTLTCSDPIALNSTAKSFYLYLPPVAEATTFTVDIMLTVNGVRRHFAKTKTGSLNLLAGKCYDFGTLTYNVASETLTDNNSISYDEIEPAGTEEDPYRIGNADEWYYWLGKYATNSEKHFLLEDSFAVGSSIAEFQGTLNGDGHTVTVSNCALFNVLNGGTVKNIITEGSISTYFHTVSSRNSCGSIAAYGSDITLNNCINRTNITQTQATGTSYLGGFVGEIKSTSGSEINGCFNEGNIIGASSRATFCIGGIIGNTSGTHTHLINCSNLGNIRNNVTTDNSSSIGGLVGKFAGSSNILENSYSVGEITCQNDDTRGGIVANVRTNTIRNCYCYSSDINLPLCHNNNGSITLCYHYGTSTVGSITDPDGTDCDRLNNPTTIQGGTSLSEQLNSNISTLGITAIARRWTVSNGYTVFVQ